MTTNNSSSSSSETTPTPKESVDPKKQKLFDPAGIGCLLVIVLAIVVFCFDPFHTPATTIEPSYTSAMKDKYKTAYTMGKSLRAKTAEHKKEQGEAYAGTIALMGMDFFNNLIVNLPPDLKQAAQSGFDDGIAGNPPKY